MILGLTFIGLRASSAHQAAALSGMAQSVGYLLAACGPPLMGKIHDSSGDWHIPLIAVAALSTIMAIFGLYAGRDKEIQGIVNIRHCYSLVCRKKVSGVTNEYSVQTCL